MWISHDLLNFWLQAAALIAALTAPGDAFSLFRSMTATQAWTVSCTTDQLKEAEEQLLKSWHSKGLREDPHEEPHWFRNVFFHLFPQQECGHPSNKNMWIEEAKIIKDQDFTSQSGVDAIWSWLMSLGLSHWIYGGYICIVYSQMDVRWDHIPTYNCPVPLLPGWCWF